MAVRDAFEIPPAIRDLELTVAAEVEALVAEAEHRQDAELLAALEAALGAVPRPLRGVVRKVLIG